MPRRTSTSWRSPLDLSATWTAGTASSSRRRRCTRGPLPAWPTTLLETYIRQLLESQRRPRGHRGLAGGRAHAHGSRTSFAGLSADRALPPARTAGVPHHPDQWHAADRRLVRAVGRAPVLGGRSASTARPSSTTVTGSTSAEPVDLRQSHAKPRPAQGARRRASTSCAR